MDYQRDFCGIRQLKAICIILSSILSLVSCERMLDGSDQLPETARLNIAVKSTVSDATSLDIWAYACDSEGKVAIDSPDAYVSSDSPAAVIECSPISRYYLVAAVTNADMEADMTFSALSQKSISVRKDNIASHWIIIDLMSEGIMTSGAEVPMELFRPYGKIDVSIAKTSQSMRLLITDVSVCSASAPSEGALISPLTPAQIKDGGRNVDQWWHEGFTPQQAAFAEMLMENLEITETGTYVSAGSTLLFENPSGWTDLTAYAENNFATNPSVEGDGYYLSIGYCYTLYPDVSLTEVSDKVIQVRKFVPLEPVCRSNEYSIKVSVDMSTIVVTGSTEVSEETDGVW